MLPKTDLFPKSSSSNAALVDKTMLHQVHAADDPLMGILANAGYKNQAGDFIGMSVGPSVRWQNNSKVESGFTPR